MPGLVSIKGTTIDGETFGGSGFIVDPSGTIVTNLHVIENLDHGAVRLATGEIYDQFVVRAFDKRRDLAIIQIPGFDLPTIKLGNSNDVEVGDPVLLIGHPIGLENSISSGIVSALREFEDSNVVGPGIKTIQTDAAANPGNSGGPMVDEDGNAIGVVTFGLLEAENLNFAIPINYARGLLNVTGSYSLTELRGELADVVDVFKQEETPKRWKSLTSGSTKVIRTDGDYLYVETLLPAEALQWTQMPLMEMKKTGNMTGDIYTGVSSSREACSYLHRGFWEVVKETKMNWCSSQIPMAITSLTPTRIEGWAEIEVVADTVEWDCQKCKWKKRGVVRKVPFAWIPE